MTKEVEQILQMLRERVKVKDKVIEHHKDRINNPQNFIDSINHNGILMDIESIELVKSEIQEIIKEVENEHRQDS